MRKLFFVVLALLLVGSFSTAYAADVRLGGGLIFEDTVWGGGLAIDIPVGDRPVVATIGADYYKKSPVTAMYVPVMLVYKTEAGESAQIYLGAGSGLGYVKIDLAALGSASSTKVLGCGVVGINFKISEKMGIFAEGNYYRLMTSGADNDLAAKAGISFSLGE